MSKIGSKEIISLKNQQAVCVVEYEEGGFVPKEK